MASMTWEAISARPYGQEDFTQGSHPAPSELDTIGPKTLFNINKDEQECTYTVYG